MLRTLFAYASLAAAVTLGYPATTFAQGSREAGHPLEGATVTVERNHTNDNRNAEERVVSNDKLPVKEGKIAVTINFGEVVHLSLNDLKRVDCVVVDNQSRFRGAADLIVFDTAGEVIDYGSESVHPGINTCIDVAHFKNLPSTKEINELYLRIALQDSTAEINPESREVEEVEAMRFTTTFIRPVTSDTGGYRKYDSQAVTGKFHTGDDYYNRDLKVLASNCGVVVKRYTSGVDDRGLGNTIVVRHDMADGGTSYSLYGHLASFAANTQPGKAVARGQQIGTMGKSGAGSNGIVHLHYEIKRAGILGNPSPYGTYGVNALGLVGYVPKWAGNRNASSATDYGYFKPSVGDYPAVCSQ